MQTVASSSEQREAAGVIKPLNKVRVSDKDRSNQRNPCATEQHGTRFGWLQDILKTRFNVGIYTVVCRSQVDAH